MSTAYGRLCMVRDKAHPITPETSVEVIASDLDKVLAHYAGMQYSLDRAKEMVDEAAAIEREACAKPLDEAAARLLAPKRTNDVDRHVASVLESHANAIRARGNL